MAKSGGSQACFLDPDYGYGDSVSGSDDRQDEGPDEEEIQLWDSFKCTEPGPSSGSMVEKRWYDVMLRIVKFVLYGFLCLAILGGSIFAKMTALFATSQIGGRPVPFCEYYLGRTPGEKYRYEATLPLEARASWIWCIIFSFAGPELLDIMRFAWNCWFFDLIFPKPRYLAVITCVEILHTVGVALLFFVCLPDLSVLHAAFALCFVCVVPNVLGFLSSFKSEPDMEETRYAVIADVVAFGGQIIGIAISTYAIYTTENALAGWMLPFALLLSSIRWWNNYVSDDCKFEIINSLAEIRNKLQPRRAILIGWISTVRIITFVLSAMLLANWRGIEFADFFEGFWMNSYKYTFTLINQSLVEDSEVVVPAELVGYMEGDRWFPLYVALINSMACILAYNCAKFSCRTLMQGAGFAFPLTIAAPMTVLCLWLLGVSRERDECVYHEGLPALDYAFFFAPGAGDYFADWLVYALFLCAVSQSRITQHIWTTKNRRLATTNRIFAACSYDALMIDQSLAMSRWRQEPEDDIFFEKHDDVEEPVKDIRNFTTVKKQDYVTKIYACATMWHETPEEMTDFLNSILRLDRDQCIMRILKKRYSITTADYYELEVHIYFDDAFCCVHGCPTRCLHDENKTKVNGYVVDFVQTVEKCIRSRNLPTSPPVKYPTPYGGRLVWILPEKTKMYVHLKDKNRIRTRKRWSQVMYMYYLLGYRLMHLPIDEDRKEVIAENTYILTLDGDIDFRPSAVRTLVDRMKINRDLGSACGRIHPLGRGPMVWFQKFEYAIGHWLQKATEHTIGCVLCSPGCFALFRAQALMNHNVMRKYASVPEEARHFIQYDQGEDRWLCTLILQRGFKVEYSAASDAYTHAPETFNEFFIQRRRWIPSTIANIFDLLETAQETKKNNRDISWIYIFYQWVLMGSTILGPGTIFLMLVGAFVTAFRIGNWYSFGYNLIPIIIFCFVCFLCGEKMQLLFAGIIAAVYGLVMIVVLVGIMIQITEDGWLAPSTLLFFIVAGELVVTGLLHPLEWTCLIYGVVYYITVPSMYLLLIVFSLFNMNNISWGTRDVPKTAPTPAPEEEKAPGGDKKPETKAKKTVKNERGPVEFSLAGLFKCILCAKEEPPQNESQLKEITTSLARIDGRLNDFERIFDGPSRPARETSSHGSSVRPEPATFVADEDSKTRNAPPVNVGVSFPDELDPETGSLASSRAGSEDEAEDLASVAGSSSHESDKFLVSPNWLHSKELGKGEVEYLQDEEEDFWKQFIGKYLDPIDKDEEREADIAKKITDLRDQYIFKFFMINALFVLTIFLMQLNKDVLFIRWPLGTKYNVAFVRDTYEVHIISDYLSLEPIGCLFILGFVSILVVQFIAMLFHRFDTFSHIMSKVSLEFTCCNEASDLSEEGVIERHAEKIMKEMQWRVEKDARSNNDSSLPPSKRMTIHKNIHGSEKKHLYAPTLSATLQQNLEDPDQNGKTSKRFSIAVRALQKRRSTTAQMRQSQMRQPNSDYAYPTTSDAPLTGITRRPVGSHYAYDNPSFVTEKETQI